jgi:hypothetical protein
MQVSVGTKNNLGKALSLRHGYSLTKVNNDQATVRNSNPFCIINQLIHVRVFNNTQLFTEMVF